MHTLRLSVTHTLQALSRLVASVLSGHRPPRWIQSEALSVIGTHTIDTHRSPLLSALAEGEHVVLPVWFPLPSRMPSPFPRPCQLCPLSLSAAIWLPPSVPLCHPLDSFPMPHPPVGASLTALNAPLSPRINGQSIQVLDSTPENIQFCRWYTDFFLSYCYGQTKSV